MSKRRLISAGLVIALIVAGLIGWRSYLKFISNKDLQDAIAEADRLDPGWRLEELEAKRAVIPPAENSAEQILAIKAMMPTTWPPEAMWKAPTKPVPGNESPADSVERAIYDLPPEMQLSPEQTRELRAALELFKGPLAKARTLAKYHNGRFPVAWPLSFTSMPHHDCAREVTNLLWHDAQLRSQDADIEGALISVLSILGVARSFGDEPDMVSQLVRSAQSVAAILALERVLAQGQCSPDSLTNLQRALEEEVSQPILLFAVRGERAREHQRMDAIENGKLKVSSLLGSSSKTFKAKTKNWWRDVSGEMEFRKSHALWIRIMTKMVEIAKLPTEEQRGSFKSYVRSIDRNETFILGMFMIPSMNGYYVESFWRNQAILRCAIIALAVERYRLGEGRWPDSLDCLTPKLLAKVPLDYDARPLRYRRLEDGVVIYSIGPEEKDNGELRHELWERPGSIQLWNATDIGFQLWDVNHRRQPWHPPAKKQDEQD